MPKVIPTSGTDNRTRITSYFVPTRRPVETTPLQITSKAECPQLAFTTTAQTATSLQHPPTRSCSPSPSTTSKQSKAAPYSKSRSSPHTPSTRANVTSIKPPPTTTLTTIPIPSIPGLTLIQNFLATAQESELLAFLTTQHWRTDLSRRCIHYGGTYCTLTCPDTIITAPAIPAELQVLLDLFVEHKIYESAAPGTKGAPGYCIVNEYTGTVGISAHVENFRFGEPVVGVTLAGGGWLRFRELEQEDDGSVRSGKAALAKRTGKVVDVWLERGSCVVMRGQARRKWQHEVVRGTARDRGGDWRRVSLTIRIDK